jgi:hypothetical protein
MDRQETFKIIMSLKAVYNAAFSKYTEADYNNLANAWMMLLGDYSYDQVSMGVRAYMSINTSQFPPVPSQVIDEIQKLNPTQELNSNEAWALVYKSIANSTYNAEDAYNKLPPAVQKAVGHPSNLKEMAQMDINTVNSVEQSHFIRVYNTTLEREKELEKLPNSIREAIGLATKERIGIGVNV